MFARPKKEMHPSPDTRAASSEQRAASSEQHKLDESYRECKKLNPHYTAKRCCTKTARLTSSQKSHEETINNFLTALKKIDGCQPTYIKMEEGIAECLTDEKIRQDVAQITEDMTSKVKHCFAKYNRGNNIKRHLRYAGKVDRCLEEVLHKEIRYDPLLSCIKKVL
ncbi:MAG: hypothetical protein HOI80_06775 [Alphaproteobacteria bacterium]|nr:hypothetical protein [Alphaproteobacteria bacterium]MBT5655176.1 hypothetical protein [Alphaproteobacteria bacterium]